MTGQTRWQKNRFFVGASGALVILTIAGACANKNTGLSEIDAYQAAVTKRSSDKALKFINGFPTSHLVGDVIESLPPGVALQTCSKIQESARTMGACQRAREIIAATETTSTSAFANDELVSLSKPALESSSAMFTVKQGARAKKTSSRPQFAIAEVQVATVQPSEIDEALIGAASVGHRSRQGGGVRGGR